MSSASTDTILDNDLKDGSQGQGGHHPKTPFHIRQARRAQGMMSTHGPTSGITP